jgi:inosine/uridine nucleosidase
VVRKIIIDCDPGLDDTMALLVAHGSPALELVGITTVAGNATVDRTTANARHVATVAGMAVPIAAGASRPLERELRTATRWHGEGGFGRIAPIEATVGVLDQVAAEYIVETVLAAPDEITLVPTAPLTNLALALRLEPHIANLVEEVVLMGGSASRGNVTPAAEYNFHTDPEAAAMVFEAPWRVTMVGLDATRHARATAEVIEHLRTIGTPVSDLAYAVLSFSAEVSAAFAGDNEPAIHDVAPVAYLADPEVLTVRDAEIHIETVGHYTTGMSVIDFTAASSRSQVATSLDPTRLWPLVLDALSRVPRSVR